MQINSKANDYVQEREKVQKWIRSKVNYQSDHAQKPYTFVRDTSHHDCQLPAIQTLDLQLRDLYTRSSLDQDMIDDLEHAQVLNWCSRAIKLKAVTTPKDGNCLVHSVSLAIWGVEDSTNVLRDLLLITARNDFHNNFKKRWERQHSQDLNALVTSTLSTSDQEWEDIIRSISNMGSTVMCAAVPHRFLESVHIYILANILRRPIIVITDSLARSITGQSLQENYIGGIYLPLEWDPAECCKTPIIIGYSLNHFCPLISEFTDPTKAREEPLFLFPLVNKDLSFLPIRYLTNEEERQAWDLVQKFFNMKELEVVGQSVHTKIPCAKMVFKPFKINLFNEHLKLCEQRCSAVMKAERQFPAINAKSPYFQIQLNSQTEVVRMPLKSNPQENVRLGQTINKCITIGCINLGDPNQGNMCDTCLKNFTIAEAGRELISLQYGSLQFYAIDVPCNPPNDEASSATKIGQIVSSVIPTAPPPSGGYMSETEMPMSMLNDRCINKCGYRSSSQTAPYCHQCFQLEREKRQQREQVLEPTAPAESMTINKSDVLIESELNLQDENITAMNSSSSEESSYLPSSISDILKQKDISGTEITWIEGGNIYSLKTPSGSHRPTASLSERSYSKLDELFCKKTECEGVRLKEKDFCLKCSEELTSSGNSGKYVTPKDVIPMTSDTNPPSAFPETSTYNGNEDIEISAELLHRCAYQNCETSVRLPNIICNKCQEIIIGYSKTQSRTGEKTREKVHQPHELSRENEREKYEASSTQSTLQHKPSKDIYFLKETQQSDTLWLQSNAMGNKINDVQREKEREINEASTTNLTFGNKFNKIDEMQRENEEVLKLKSKDFRSKPSDIQGQTDRPMQQASNSSQSKFKFESENLSRRSSSLSPKSINNKVIMLSIGQHCKRSGCQNYGDPAEDNMCSSCYRKNLKIPFPLQRHLESRQHNNALAQPIMHFSESRVNNSKYGTSVHQSSTPSDDDYLTSLATSIAPYKYIETEVARGDVMATFKSTFSNYKRETPPSFRHDVVTSKSSFASRYGMQEQPSSGLHEANQRLHQAYERTVRNGSQGKCKEINCKNYGNPKKQGYCNSCFKIFQQKQSVDTYGDDVPDKLK